MICENIQLLINYALKNGLIQYIDEIVIRNRLMNILQVSDWQQPEAAAEGLTVDEILDRLTDYACEKGIIENTANNRDLFDTKLMGELTLLPHEVYGEFRRRYESVSPKDAVDNYYEYSKKVNYVRAGRIAKDLRWKYSSEYGDLDISINLSKPEKDPRDIAKQGQTKSAAYPKCQLCPENAGFSGTLTHPEREIVFNEKHVPMKIDHSMFEKLFDFIEYIPHYFIGSNADLPIVGGSILSHEHFQGGNYTFPMETAPIETQFSLKDYPNVKAGIVKWPMSVIRLRSDDRNRLAGACSHILDCWRGYSDSSVNIFAETDGVPHNTITPIARMKTDCYECDLALRNNLTTEERPLGLYHPNPELHHIKKENIGLIEVMGLAVLPSRLSKELKEVEKALLEGKNMSENPLTASHEKWAKDILAAHPEFNAQNAEEIIRAEVGRVFEQVLSDSGVFKRTDEGREAFMRFIEKVKS